MIIRPPGSSVPSWKAGRRKPAGKRCSIGRNLPDKDKEGLSEKKAIALMLAQPSMIKRPVLELGGSRLLVEFSPELYEKSV
jgi:arsenate reductase